MICVSEIFAMHGGPSRLARSLGRPIQTVHRWAQRNSIPKQHWQAIAALGLITAATLAEAHAPPEGDDCTKCLIDSQPDRKRRSPPRKPRAPLLALDPEFRMASRGDAIAACGPMEFALLEALTEARRPAYTDWLAERAGAASRRAVHKTVHRLRQKLAPLGVAIVRHRSDLGEEGAYSLSKARRRRA
jgi:hypothetical protein